MANDQDESGLQVVSLVALWICHLITVSSSSSDSTRDRDVILVICDLFILQRKDSPSSCKRMVR